MKEERRFTPGALFFCRFRRWSALARAKPGGDSCVLALARALIERRPGMKDKMGKFIRGALPLSAIMVAAATAVSFTGRHSRRHSRPRRLSFDGEIADFYRARGGAPLWFAPALAAPAPQLLQLLATAEADRLNPRRYNMRGFVARGR